MGGSGNLPIGPGVWGFIAAFVLALALWLLMRNMNSRMRRMAYRERDRAAGLDEESPEGGDERSGQDPVPGDPSGRPGDDPTR
ncbi:MAG TPA: hypothetical protein VFJ94_16065 [Intrasporangium sp.]|uniref:hypothetical protein n=1 Tax=Intrasporangium sp. TaxID=1925024 RepID=UPI002D79447D|nr:hypothetical protein [Intrasporangium sp.]HET7400032.1 hypothetical protein [Intrasporangium sp.]